MFVFGGVYLLYLADPENGGRSVGHDLFSAVRNSHCSDFAKSRWIRWKPLQVDLHCDLTCAEVCFMHFICREQTNCLFHLHQISASATRNSGAVLAPRALRQPHCQIVASKEGDKAFVLGSLGGVLQGIHFLTLCQVLSPPGVATSLVFFLFATNTERNYPPTHPPTRTLHGYLYPRMLKCVGLRISIHVCWSAWVCVSLSTYAEARGFVFDDAMMMIDMMCVTTGMTTQKTKFVKK